MSEEITNTPIETSNKTTQLSIRVLTIDKEWYMGLSKGFKTQAEAFTFLLDGYHKNLNKTIENVEPITEKEQIEKVEVIETEPKPMFSNELMEKLSGIREYLKSKDRIPKECTDFEFIENFMQNAVDRYLKNGYKF